MKNGSCKERDFIQGVWRKVRYLEYVQSEQETIKENQRKLREKKLRIGILLTTFVLLMTVPLFIFFGIGMFSLVLNGFAYLSAGALYEYLVGVETDRRNYGANQNKEVI